MGWGVAVGCGVGVSTRGVAVGVSAGIVVAVAGADAAFWATAVRVACTTAATSTVGGAALSPEQPANSKMEVESKAKRIMRELCKIFWTTVNIS